MPRERADSDYCLLVQPAVIGLQSVDCYCQPRMEFTNASAPFCLLCAATDSCNAIGARIESCVVRHYGLDVSAIQQEVREWDALVKGVLEAKKEEKRKREEEERRRREEDMKRWEQRSTSLSGSAVGSGRYYDEKPTKRVIKNGVVMSYDADGNLIPAGGESEEVRVTRVEDARVMRVEDA